MGGLPGKMPLEQKCEQSKWPSEDLGDKHSGRGKGKCKGPGAGMSAKKSEEV